MGSSTIGKGDTSRSGLRGDVKGGGYSMRGNSPQSNIAAKRNNLAGYQSIAPNPKVNLNKVAVEKPPAKLPPPTGVATVTPVKVKNIPRTYVPAKPKVVAVKPPVKKPVVKKPIPASVRARAVASPNAAFNRNKPPATRFGTVTGKTTGTTARGGGGYGGGGTRGSGSLSGQGSGSRQAGTSRTGGTRRNDPVRG